MDLKVLLQAALAERYDIEDEIGKGATAIVYAAVDRVHDRTVALKALRPELSAEIGAERFLREIQIESHLQHPHILPLHESGEADGLLYYTMPLVSGESLEVRLEKDRQLPVEFAVRIAREVADGLSYAHSEGVVHRDIKPANILLSADHAVLADFGIARAISEAAGDRLTSTGISVGTPIYMSPEQAVGEGVDGRSDMYSLGCVLFEMLAGEPPFSGKTTRAVAARHMFESPPSLEVLRPGTPPHIARAVEVCLAKVPADRFESATDLIDALDDKLEGISITRPASRPPSRRKWPWLLALGAAAAVVAGGLSLVLGPSMPDLDPNRVVVFPVVEEPRLDEGGAGYAVALAIEAALDHAEPLKWIDGWQRLSPLQRENMALLTGEEARRITLERGARYYLCGAIQTAGAATTVTLLLYDAEGDTLVARESATGTSDQFVITSLEAVTAILPDLVDPGREIDLGPLRARRPAAIALWIQGEREYRRSRFSEALDLYERAVEEDSSLIFAAIKGAQAASWSSRFQEAEALAAIAVNADTLLPDRYRHLAHGLYGYVLGNADSAAAWLKRLLELDSEWAEAHMALGEVYYHQLPSDGPLDSLAQASFSAALAVDSAFSPPIHHLAEIALRQGQLTSGVSLLSKYQMFQPEAALASQLSLMEQCLAASGEFDWPVPSADDAAPTYLAATRFIAGGYQPDCAEDGLRAVLASGSTTYAWGAVLGLQSLLVARGRYEEATALLDSTIADGESGAMNFFLLDAVAGAPMVDKAQGVVDIAKQYFGQTYESLPSPMTLWLLGSFHAMRGEIAELEAVYEVLMTRVDEGRPGAAAYADAIGAQIALARLDTANALSTLIGDVSVARLGDVTLDARERRDNFFWWLAYQFPGERLTLARLLYKQGRYDAALRAASVFDQEPIVFVPFLPASLEVRIAAAEALGRTDLAEEFDRRLRRLRQ